MTERQPNPDDHFQQFAAHLDAFLGQPRHDHGLPIDEPGLGRAILAQPDLSAGALVLRERLVEQIGPAEGHRAWIAAWEWVKEHHRSVASEQLNRALDALIAVLHGGHDDEGLLAEAGALLEELEDADPDGSER